VALLEKNHTSDVDGVVKTRFINGTMPVPVVDSQTRKSENILGSNGIRKSKKLNMVLKMRLTH